jgi:hypothetical protein
MRQRSLFNKQLYPDEMIHKNHLRGASNSHIQDPIERELADIETIRQHRSVFCGDSRLTETEELRKKYLIYFQGIMKDKSKQINVSTMNVGDGNVIGSSGVVNTNALPLPLSPAPAAISTNKKSKAIWVAIIAAVGGILAAGITAIFGH